MLAAYLWQQPRPPQAAAATPAVVVAAETAPRKVLELACGSAALPGLALALGGHDEVTFADLPEVLPLARRNVRCNARSWGVDLSHRVRFLRFDWQDAVPPELSADLILGSDIVYGEGHIEPIRRWLRTLLRRQRVGAPPAEAVLAGENRSGTLGKLLAKLAGDGIEVTPLPIPESFADARWEHPHPYSKLELYRLRSGGALACPDTGATTGKEDDHRIKMSSA